ncbi:DUF6300 family protein [Streptomyces sp. NBC_01255]
MIETKNRLPQCSRCRGDLVISAVAPVDDARGRPVHLELCPACDTGDTERPAAADAPSLLRCGSRSGAGRGPRLCSPVGPVGMPTRAGYQVRTYP